MAVTVATRLPIQQTDDQDMHMMQTRWASILNPVLSNELLNGQVLSNVELISGVNVINHKLGRPLQGWLLVRQRAAGTVYDNQDSATFPTLNLVLVSSAPMSVDIYVF